MNPVIRAESLALWLADYYFLASVLLAAALVTSRFLKQPVQRLAIAKATVVALFLLAILCAIPGWSLVHLFTSQQPRANGSQAAPLEPLTVADAPTITTADPIDTESIAFTPPAAQQDEPPFTPQSSSNWRELPWARIGVAAHGIGTVFVFAWLMLGALAAHRLQRSAQPAPAELSAVLAEVAALQNISSRLPDLRISNRIDVAVALGIFRPTVLLPTKWLKSHAPEQLRTVLAHELAHVANHDLRWLAASRTLFMLLWAQPLLWFVRRRMRLDQESLADAAAADITSRQRYAEQLVGWARQIPARPVMHISAAVGLWEGPSQLRQRIAVLLDDKLTVFRQCSRRWRIATLALSALAAMSLSTVTLEKAQSQPDEEPSKPSIDSITQSSEAKNAPPQSQSAEPAFPASATLSNPFGEFRVIPGVQANVLLGRCVDENGAPISGLKVLLLDLSTPDQLPEVKHETTTDASGNYRFENVVDVRTEFPNGRIPLVPQLNPHFLQVLIRGAGRVTTIQLATTVDVARNGHSWEHTLRPAATLRGRVTGPDERPVVGALVAVGATMFHRLEGAQSSRTDVDGRYEINDLAPFDVEKFRAEQEAQRQRNLQTSRRSSQVWTSISTSPPMISVEHPAFALFKAPYEQIPGTKDLQLEPAAIVEGRVVYADSGRPAANVRLQARTQLPERLPPPADFVYRIHTVYARTNTDGRFRITTLPEGIYDVWPLSDEWLHPRVAVRTKADQVTTVPEFRLTRGRIVRVRLVSAIDGKPVAVSPNDQAGFFVRQVVGRLFLEAPTQTVKPQSDGTFEARALPGSNAITLFAVVSDDKLKWLASEQRPKIIDVPINDSAAVSVDVAVEAAPAQDGQTDTSADETANLTRNEPVEIPIIVAKHVLLHDRKIIEWADLEKMIAALPNPKLAQPGFYFTHGAAADRQEEVRAKIWDLRRRIPMHGHSWGSISPRTSPHYDAIRTADDLKPNDAWRINGTVETADGLPIDGAEVVLLMPVDEALPYKTLDVYLRNERLRERADEVVTTSDNSGRFAVYPRPETPYYLVALHREGFGLVRSDSFAKSQRVTIQPWAHVRGEVKQDARFKQSASHSERVPADGGWPEITFHQYSEDLGPASPNGQFEFAFVPPNLDGTLSRSIQGEQGTSFGLPATKFKLPPGETLTVDLEPPSDEEAARVEMLKSADGQRQRDAEAARAAEEARKVNPNELAGRVVDADGKPLSGVVVDVWTWHAGNETLTDADGRFKLVGFDDREVVEVQFMKPGYGPALFVAQQVGDPNWTVTLANDTYLEGRVLDPAGNPLPNMRIRAARGPFTNPQVVIDEVWISTSTDGEGAYRLYVEPDKYDVHVRVPGVGLARLQNTALAKGEKRQLDIQLRQGPTFRALVLDIETNEPVAGIRLWNWRQEGIEGVADDAGMVTIENMTPGPFEFDVTAVGEARGSDLAGKYARWWSPDATEEHQRKIEYDSSSFQRNFDDLTFNILGNTEPVKIYVEKAVSIRGRVTDPDGNPVAGATVAPAKTGTGNSITGDTRYSVRTESDGTFHIRLPASNNAKYNLVAHDGDFREWRNWANGVGEVLTTRPGEELADVVLQLTRPGVVRGKVVDGDGKPMAKHRVRTQPTDHLENRYYDPETRTNENGEFELKFVRPGEHFVQADPFWLVDNQAESEASKRITVKPGETVDGIELIHRPAESRPPIDHILPGVAIPKR